MPRYYFHLTREGERITDDEGARLDPADLKAELLLRLLEKCGMENIQRLSKNGEAGRSRSRTKMIAWCRL